MPKKFKRVANVSKEVLTKLSRPVTLTPVEEVPLDRRPYASRDANLVVGHRGLVYGPDGVFTHSGAGPVLDAGVSTGEMIPALQADAPSDDTAHFNRPDEQRMAKNQRLWHRWSNEVIPAMVKPLLELLARTSSLCMLDNVRREPRCGGCQNGRLLSVFCVFFDSGCFL